MKISMTEILFIIICFVFLNLLISGIFVIQRIKKRIFAEKNEEARDVAFRFIKGESVELSNGINYEKIKGIKQIFKAYFRDNAVRDENKDSGKYINKYISKYVRMIKSFRKVSRIEASSALGIIGTDEARIALEEALSKEKLSSVKIYIVNSLAEIGSEKSIPVMVNSLKEECKWYRKKANMLIADMGEKFKVYLPEILDSKNLEIRDLIVDFGSVYICEDLRNYLVKIIDSKEEFEKLYEKESGVAKALFYYDIVLKAAEVLAEIYPAELSHKRFLEHSDSNIGNIAVKALANYNYRENLSLIFEALKKSETQKIAVNSLNKVIERDPALINELLRTYNSEKDSNIKILLADVLSFKIEYFIMKLMTNEKEIAANVIKNVLKLGKTSVFTDFLNKNTNRDIENEILPLLKEVIKDSEELEKEFCIFLDERILKKLGLLRCDKLLERGRENKKDEKFIKNLFAMMFFLAILFPVIYIVRHTGILDKSLWFQLTVYLLDFNYYLVAYSVGINIIYFVLLILSFILVNKQTRLWKAKSRTMLFKKRMLPSVSIIAPAFNEENTIIESINSLMNLVYPDYELVVVNDGSKDGTLARVIKYFKLVRVDRIYKTEIETMPIRGIYMNPSMPSFVLVDKENGGKADSLDAGINVSQKEYFCGIDADSLLEDEALLKLTSLTLDEDTETPALGGNIFPINGCKVDKGLITNFAIPKNSAARFQTIEYIRAFMAGRLGWAYINGLLIISGAFGLFRKKRIVGIGGYLTKSGVYGKDTVGEDMGLVVRIRRLMKELKLSFKIGYAFNANCWTEVPEDLASLKKQRLRWHRGLLEIISFHKKMIFNPFYGKTGIMATPYFFVFEVAGPLIEIQGYFMVFLAFILGLLNIEVALLLFVATVLMGITISLAALLIAERDMKHFKFGEIFTLVIFAVIENFGIRQLFSFWRVMAYFNMLLKPSGWGKLERKGFSAK